MDRVAALIGLRLRLAAREARGAEGVANLLSSILLLLLGTLLSLGLALVVALLARDLADRADPGALRLLGAIVLHVCAFFGLFLPLLSGVGSPGSDLRRFLHYPVARSRLYALSLTAASTSGSQLFHYPMLAALLVAAYLIPGHRPLASLAFFAAFVLAVVAWSHALTLSLQGLLRRRRARELLLLLGFALVTSLSFVPVFLEERLTGPSAVDLRRFVEVTRGAERVLAVLPPSLAAEALDRLGRGETAGWLGRAAALLAWGLAGVAAGYAAFARDHSGEGAGRVGAARARPGPAGPDLLDRVPVLAAAARWLPDATVGAASTQWSYLLRSVLGRFNLLMTPLLVVFLVLVLARDLGRPVLGMPADAVTLYGLVVYLVLFSNNLINNAFSWDGPGAQLYFLAPARLEAALAGKNLGVWLFNAVLFALTLGAWSVLKGPPTLVVALTAALVFASTLVGFTTAGNVISVFFPAARDIGSLRSTPSQIAIVLSLVSMAGNALLVAAALFAGLFLGPPWAQPLAVLALLLEVGAYVLVGLGAAARLWQGRMEPFLEALRRR